MGEPERKAPVHAGAFLSDVRGPIPIAMRLPVMAVRALEAQQLRQKLERPAAGAAWQGNANAPLVFAVDVDTTVKASSGA